MKYFRVRYDLIFFTPSGFVFDFGRSRGFYHQTKPNWIGLEVSRSRHVLDISMRRGVGFDIERDCPLRLLSTECIAL